MGYIQGEGRNQGTLFPVVLDDLIPIDHLCRVIDAFVDGLAMSELSFERAEAAETGRPGYDPRDLLKLYLYGYLNQIRSSRRLEAECRRNVELMWLLGRLYPDHKSIAEFRRMHRDAITAVGAELVRFARSCGLIRGEWVAIDGTKFRAVSSTDSVRERQALEKYLESMEKADDEQQVGIDPTAVQAALEKLRQHAEPEAHFMPVAHTKAPAYNVQTAVDAEHALIVAHAITLNAGDGDCLEPMAEAARKALNCTDPINILADNVEPVPGQVRTQPRKNRGWCCGISAGLRWSCPADACSACAACGWPCWPAGKAGNGWTHEKVPQIQDQNALRVTPLNFLPGRNYLAPPVQPAPQLQLRPPSFVPSKGLDARGRRPVQNLWMRSAYLRNVSRFSPIERFSGPVAVACCPFPVIYFGTHADPLSWSRSSLI